MTPGRYTKGTFSLMCTRSLQFLSTVQHIPNCGSSNDAAERIILGSNIYVIYRPIRLISCGGLVLHAKIILYNNDLIIPEVFVISAVLSPT